MSTSALNLSGGGVNYPYQILNVTDDPDKYIYGWKSGNIISIKIVFKKETTYSEWTTIGNVGFKPALSSGYVLTGGPETNGNKPAITIGSNGQIESTGGTYPKYSYYNGTFITIGPVT